MKKNFCFNPAWNISMFSFSLMPGLVLWIFNRLGAFFPLLFMFKNHNEWGLGMWWRQRRREKFFVLNRNCVIFGCRFNLFIPFLCWSIIILTKVVPWKIITIIWNYLLKWDLSWNEHSHASDCCCCFEIHQNYYICSSGARSKCTLKTAIKNFNINCNTIFMKGYHITTENRRKRFCFAIEITKILFLCCFWETTIQFCASHLLSWFLVSLYELFNVSIWMATANCQGFYFFRFNLFLFWKLSQLNTKKTF